MKAGFQMTLLACTALGMAFPGSVSALTVRTKFDLRLWGTVTDCSRPISWSWQTDADAASLTFSNRLTHSVLSTNVTRTAGTLRGFCSHPVPSAADDALVVATLVQTAGGVEIARDAVELAYVSGASGRPLTVRTKSDRSWRRVPHPRLAAFDARWWNVAGPSGYEVLWTVPAGWHRVERAFEGEGVVDEVVLKFGTSGLLLFVR